GSTANLSRSALAALMLVVGEDVYYVRVRGRRLPDLPLSHGPRACFEAEVEDVLLDVVSYATITSGIEFRLNEPDQVLPGWREAVAAMGALAPTLPLSPPHEIHGSRGDPGSRGEAAPKAPGGS